MAKVQDVAFSLLNLIKLALACSSSSDRALLRVKMSHSTSPSQLLWGSVVVFLRAKDLLEQAGRLQGTGHSSSSAKGFEL